jgi:chemotaxis protein histidine kinase CheA
MSSQYADEGVVLPLEKENEGEKENVSETSEIEKEEPETSQEQENSEKLEEDVPEISEKEEPETLKEQENSEKLEEDVPETSEKEEPETLQEETSLAETRIFCGVAAAKAQEAEVHSRAARGESREALKTSKEAVGIAEEIDSKYQETLKNSLQAKRFAKQADSKYQEVLEDVENVSEFSEEALKEAQEAKHESKKASAKSEEAFDSAKKADLKSIEALDKSFVRFIWCLVASVFALILMFVFRSDISDMKNEIVSWAKRVSIVETAVIETQESNLATKESLLEVTERFRSRAEGIEKNLNEAKVTFSQNDSKQDSRLDSHDSRLEDHSSRLDETEEISSKNFKSLEKVLKVSSELTEGQKVLEQGIETLGKEVNDLKPKVEKALERGRENSREIETIKEIQKDRDLRNQQFLNFLKKDSKNRQKRLRESLSK